MPELPEVETPHNSILSNLLHSIMTVRRMRGKLFERN